ncbi:metalloendopeptidase [Coemansia sp. Cherry 401B]|nr:metalloendopeptidase [Coemansia sp. Cherry 401B]
MTAHMSTAPAKGTVLNFNLSPAEIHRTTDRLIAESTAVQDRVAAESRPTFESVIVPLAMCENEQSAEYNVVTFVQSVSTDKEVRDASTAAEEKLREFEIESQMREDVYKVVRAVFDNASEMDKLGAEDRRLVEKMELGYRRNGLALDKDKREQLGVKQKRLSELEVRFSRNINENDGAEAFTREELVGLPDDFFEGRQIKIEDGVEKFVVTTKYPDLVPLLKKAKNETTRRRMLYADETRCPENIALMQEAVRLRLEIAQMLGYKTHAEFKLELSMAKAPATVLDFEDDLRQRLEPLADRELKEIEALKRADKEAAGEPYEGLFSWDFRYYSAMVLERKHQISDDEVKQYFSMQSVLRGVLDIYERMLSLKFVRVENAPVWHPDVELYEVWEADGTTFTGHFYLDLYPRESKYSHAAAFPIRSGFTRADGTKEYPVTAMVTNFPKPTPTTPALQKHDDVITLLHEFGHVMHGICSRTKWARFHGTSTEGDFVECPSQMLENWGWEPSALQKFAVHYQTGEPIPTDLIKRLVAAKNEGAGLFNLRQIFFGLYDMSIHHTTDPNVDVKQNFLRMREQITHFSNDSNDTWGMACFGHMLGGYDAGYFGYLWSLVYASDLFESRFKHDLESAKAGADYRHEILLPGGSRDSMISLERFLGRKPNNKAFLRSIGLN